MAPDEPTWDDTGFDSGSNDNSGFMSSGGRKRVNPPEPPAPPPPQRRKDDNRGPLFWFGVLAGVVLVLAVVGGFFYWLAQPSVEEQAFMASSESEQVVRTDEQPSAEPAPEVDVTASDDVVHDPEALDLLFGEDTAAADNATAQEKPAPAETSRPIAAAKPTPAPSPEPAKRPSTTTTTTTAPPPATPTPAPTKTTAKKPVTPAPTPKTETTTSKTSSALYVIQVFSSPSRMDADQWIQRLRSQNVSDAYITEQQIKDQTWYRVRFGSFSTRQAAEAEAIRLGFKEPWIARVR